MTATPPAHPLRDPAAFYRTIRHTAPLGLKLSQAQVDGCEALLAACAAWPLAWAAYGLGTAAWETGRTMQPVREIGRGKGRPYGVPGRNGGQVAYGRGYVQLTWDENYERMDAELGLGGVLIADYELACEPKIAAEILVAGMAKGLFTGRKLADVLPRERPGYHREFVAARPIINGHDRAKEIAGLAWDFQGALVAAGWRGSAPGA